MGQPCRKVDDSMFVRPRQGLMTLEGNRNIPKADEGDEYHNWLQEGGTRRLGSRPRTLREVHT